MRAEGLVWHVPPKASLVGPGESRFMQSPVPHWPLSFTPHWGEVKETERKESEWEVGGKRSEQSQVRCRLCRR